MFQSPAFSLKLSLFQLFDQVKFREPKWLVNHFCVDLAIILLKDTMTTHFMFAIAYIRFVFKISPGISEFPVSFNIKKISSSFELQLKLDVLQIFLIFQCIVMVL